MAACLCMAVALMWTATAGASTLQWTAPVLVDDGDPAPFALFAAACPASTTCLLGDEAGAVLAAADPTGPAGAWALNDLTSSGLTAIMDIACAGPSFCVAIDNSGHVAVSTRPASGLWQVALVDPGRVLIGVSCPTEAFCAAVDDAGHVLVSTHPVDGATAWTSETVDAPTRFADISCPSAALCVAVDASGRALVSTAPTAGDGAWTALTLASGKSFAAVSCPTAALCVAVDTSGESFMSTTPDGPATTWSMATRSGTVWDDVACPSPSLCVALSDDGGLFSTTTPSDAPIWALDAATAAPVEAVACASGPLCVAVDDLGQVWSANGTSVPFNTSAPAVSGTPAPGETVTCLPGTWSGTAVSLSYQWRYDDNRLWNGNGPTLYLDSGFDGHRLSCTVTAKNAAGTATATSESHAVSIALSRPQIGGATIAGDPTVGSQLTCFASIAGGTSILHEWARDGVSLGAPTADEHYVPVAADAGHLLTCTISSSNRNGTARATSTGVTVKPAPVPVVVPFSAGVVLRPVRLATLLARGLPAVVTCSTACTIRVGLAIDRRAAGRLGFAISPRKRAGIVTIGSGIAVLASGGTQVVRFRLRSSAARRLAQSRPRVLTLLVRPTEPGKRRVGGARSLAILR